MIKATNPGLSIRRILLASALMALAVIACNGSFASAQSTAKVKRRVIPVTISKGQNYTISGVEEGTGPNPKVVSNPHALVIQNAPGRIELVGADSGTWKINVQLDSGEKVTYVVTVKADAPPQGSLVPGAAPTVMP
jgi:hypothetical protein